KSRFLAAHGMKRVMVSQRLRCVFHVGNNKGSVKASTSATLPWGFRSKTKGRRTLSQVVFSTKPIMLLMRPGGKRHGAPAGVASKREFSCIQTHYGCKHRCTEF